MLESDVPEDHRGEFTRAVWNEVEKNVGTKRARLSTRDLVTLVSLEDGEGHLLVNKTHKTGPKVSQYWEGEQGESGGMGDKYGGVTSCAEHFIGLVGKEGKCF